MKVKPKLNWNRSVGYNLDILGMQISKVITDGPECYPWKETFVIWPRRSVSGAPLFWTKAYKRRVWLVWGTSFHMEPETQYATAFDLLTHNDNDYIKG